MQVTVEAGSGLERRMTVQVPEEQIATQVQTRLNSLRRTVRLHGFRPGKVPQRVLERTYGRKVRDEVVSSVLQSSLLEAFGQQKINPASRPSIDAVEAKPGQGLSYTAVFEVYPEISVPDVKAIKLHRPVVEVTVQDVDAMIETLRRQRRTWASVEREAAAGDQAIIDYRGLIDGEDFQGSQGMQVAVELGTHRLIEGFEEGLIGAKAGEERVLDLKFPNGYHDTALAGKPVRFTVSVREVQEAHLPDIDQAFFEAFGVREGGEEALRKEVRENMERELRGAIRAKLRQEVMDALLGAVKVDLPTALVQEEAGRLMEQTRQGLVRRGAIAADLQLLPSMFEEQARRRVALGLILVEVVKANNLATDPAKVKVRVESIASTYQDPQEVVSWYYADKERLAEIESLVMEDEVVDWVVEHADVTDEPSTFDAIMKPGQTSS
jgi:trigger factor